MNNKLKSVGTLTVLILFLLASPPLFAQEVEMAEKFRQEGKIYVVIAVMCILFAFIFGYLIYLDRKINKLKK